MFLYAIATSSSPVVFKNLNVLSRQRAAEPGIDVGAELANVSVLRGGLDNVDVSTLIQTVHARHPVERETEAPHEGFLGQHDRRALDALRTAESAVPASIKPGFSDPRLDERFLGNKERHFSGIRWQHEHAKWVDYRFRKLIIGNSGNRRRYRCAAPFTRCRAARAAPVACV
jgi:exodeoxyribonuclease-1